MADNITINGVQVATDEVTTRDGTTVPAEHVQRMKPGYGSDGSYQGVDRTHPFPVTDTTLFAGTLATTSVNVGTGSTSGVAARSARTLIECINQSDTAIWLGLDTSVGGTPAAAVDAGVWLGPNGGYWSSGYTGAVRAIHASTGTKKLLIVEW